MSMTHNTSISSRAKGEWRIMPHPDHCNSPVTTRRMTEEEKQKYGFGRTDIMPEKLNISTETLLEECRAHGLNAKAARIIAEKYGFTERQILNMINHRKIKEKLKEKTKIEGVFEPEQDKTVPKINITTELIPNITTEIIPNTLGTFFDKLSESLTSEVVEQKPVTATKGRLKPKIMIGQTEFEYELYDEFLSVRRNGEGQYLHIDWKDIAELIEDLKELKKIAGE